MNHESHPGDETALPDSLRFQLRALRQEVPPPTDLWPGIESRIRETEARPRQWLPALALAASVLVAVGAFGLLATRTATDVQPDRTALNGAHQLTSEYDSAIRAMPDATRSKELAPALGELDRSVREIRHALSRDPDSHLLLEQLRRTYALKLALSQRAAVG